MTKTKLDTQAMGLDVGLTFVKWLTGSENLHYGYWEGLDLTAGNLAAAQDAYTERLFELLPPGPLRILDIGGGAGVTAAKLIALGHQVEIVVPSPLLAERCAVNAPQARVHQCRFEAFRTETQFDLCLFSESFQYIPLDQGLAKCLTLLSPEGQIIVADCFRAETYKSARNRAVVGGGHGIARFRDTLAALPLEVAFEEDITRAVAPSVEIEQGLFNVFGYGITRVDEELQAKRPKLRWLLNRVWRALMSERRRLRLDQRLNEQTRNREVFAANNVYLMMRLARR